jgi:hypothetical protein
MKTLCLAFVASFLVLIPRGHGQSPTPTASPSRLLNISARAGVGTGDRAAIVGFIIEGSAKDVIVRGLGPSLQNGGSPVPGRLLDPTLELYSANQNIGFNDDWRTQESQIQATGIPPTNDRESAIVAHLDPGGFTAILRGKNNTTGIGLAEVYDLATTGTSKIKNLSARGFVSTGDNVLIGGFIVGGGGTGIRLVIRVLGPSLSNAGVTDSLQDPTLELFNANGNAIGANDNWQDDQQFQIAQSGLAPPRSTEAALLTELSPGNYTVIAAGRNGTSGTALLELYDVPQPPPTAEPSD